MQIGNKKPLLIVGIVMVILGLRYIISYHIAGVSYDAVMGSNILLDFEDVQGVCTKVEKAASRRYNVLTGYDAYVTYEYNGKKYEDMFIEHYEKTLKVGDTVDLKVAKTMPGFCIFDYPFAYYDYYSALSYVIFVVGAGMIGLFFYLRSKDPYS